MNKKILIGLGIIFAIGLFFTTADLAAAENSSSNSSCLEVKTNTLNLLVKDIKESQEKIFKFTEEKDGEIAQSAITQREETSFASITVLVPVENFEEATIYFKELGKKVLYEKTSSRNIKEEYCDLGPRLKNLEEEEDELLKLMERKGTISEALEAQRDLTRVRDELRKIQGQKQCLEREAKMATIEINLGLSEKPLPSGWRQTNFLIDAMEDLLTFLRMLGYFVIEVIVWAVVWVPLLLIILYLQKSRRKAAKPR
ncbi:DUF4349 domain-containing protein [Patescibacteria group bacterium]|nr:DUF4349 domain-containing protein [Patescibacteria group bacterium]MBU4480842.1 DUF4349 domain-containing protein [Patescibacteria group bacterium]